ncbi:MAG: PASTA domain-containing protein [bacterium]
MDFLRFIFSLKFLKHFLIMIGITAVLIWFVLLSLSWYTKHDEFIVVPDFRTMYINDVIGNPDYRDYNFMVSDSVFDPEKQSGTILFQDPYAGSRVKRNRMVYFAIVSFVPEKTAMPDLKDLTLRQAQTMLETAGLRLGKLMYIRSFDEDAVQQQFFRGKPIPLGTKIDKGSKIDLTVGMGAKAQEMKIDTTAEDSIQ